MRTLKGRSLELQEFQKEHLPVLFSWRTRDDFMSLCSTRRNLVSLDEFRLELEYDFKKDRHLQFLIKKEEEYIGTLYSYNLNRTDGHVFVTVYLPPLWRGMGYGAEAMIIFLDHLFREYDLHKIYADVYSYNRKSLRALISGGFIEEGRFREHRLHLNERHDLIRLALFRSRALTFAPLVKNLAKRASSS